MTPDSGAASAPRNSPTAGACELHGAFIELSPSRGRNTKAFYLDLADDHGCRASSQSVNRVVGKRRDSDAAEACAVIVTPPGEDYGRLRHWPDGPRSAHRPLSLRADVRAHSRFQP